MSDPDLRRILEARHHDPHAVLGRHRWADRDVYRVLIPGAVRVEIEASIQAVRLGETDLFEATIDVPLPVHPRIRWWDGAGGAFEQVDPYSFVPDLPAEDLLRFGAGTHQQAWRFLGAHLRERDGVSGVRFAVWAPNAERASVVGPFCLWDGRRYPMRNLGASGVWELFVPGIDAHALYRFELRNRNSGTLHLKSDPYGRASELRPGSASVVAPSPGHHFADEEWLRRRAGFDWLHGPLSIYEVHAGSWKRGEDGRFLTWRELARELIPHVKSLGFTHLELLPITEHPLDESWGYQTTGYFCPTSRHGSADDLRFFIDECHAAGLGVILDWVPAHFPRDAHALANFDGTALYEYADPRKAEHRDWGTLVFDYERHEVRSFLLSSACYWLEEFHFDGLRVDAVASMLYLDYSRRGEDYVPNRHGGNHNLEAIEFLRELNRVVHGRFPGALVIAEESTEWPMVSRPIELGGLGFSMKWNMGWMHDTLAYFREDPIYRRHHHEKLTFGMLYAYTENFVLPLSHDEVVHLKRSLLGKMPGDPWQRFANLRLLLAWMWAWPGKKLLFMGAELAQEGEWDFAASLPWELAAQPERAGVARLLGDLNRLHREDSRLHARDFEPAGFRWIDCNDRDRSLLAFLRRRDDADAAPLLVALNFTPVPRHQHRIGVPRGGRWREILNTDAAIYGGGNVGNLSTVEARPESSMGQPFSLDLTLPPLGAVFLAPEG